MFSPRATLPLASKRDPDGVKLYTISASGKPVDIHAYLPRFDAVKKAKGLSGQNLPAFAIFHDGAGARYLVLAWWGNDNELFTSVSVEQKGQWLEDPSRFSFCLWDLEVIWHERNSFIRHLYSGNEDLDAYRADLKPANT